MAERVKRRYDSSRRREQAAENRRRIVAAAHALFVEKGYGRTTIADVAAAAGVAVETVYAAFRNKPTLLRLAWELAVRGDDARDVPFHETPGQREIHAHPDVAVRLTRQAAVNVGIMRRTTPLALAVRGAAGSEPGALEILAEFDRDRLAAYAAYARAAATTGQLAVSEDEARDVMWSTTDGTLWHHLVQRCGWSDDRYATWLAHLWTSLLVAPDERSAR